KGKKETLRGLRTTDRLRGTEPGTRQRSFRGLTSPRGEASKESKTATTTVIRTGDKFTAVLREGALAITIKGAGSGSKTEVHVRDGGKSNTYDSVDKVPEQYRARVKSLIEMATKGEVRSEVK